MGDSIYTVKLVIVVKDYEQVVVRIKMNFADYLFFMLNQILREYEPKTIID